MEKNQEKGDKEEKMVKKREKWGNKSENGQKCCLLYSKFFEYI